jgi:hypothetical protein
MEIAMSSTGGRTFTTSRGPRRLLLAAALLLTGCPDDVAGPKPIADGVWQVSAGTGLSGSFTVAANPRRVTSLRLYFAGWTCGPATVQGHATYEGELEILGRDIDLTVVLGQGNRITFKGNFADDGARASGTWNASWSGSARSGSWQAQCP